MSSYAFDDDFAKILEFLPTVMDFSTVEKIQEIRNMRASMFGAGPDRDDVAKEDRTVPGLDGAPDVPVRVYRPAEESDAPLPCVVEIHGGGFIMGSIDMMDPWCQHVTTGVGCVVVSVGYRLAPEHPFPAALDDCWAVLGWAAAHASELGIDPDRIALAGQSAGGCLAAATALRARDEHGPPVCFQLLEIPVLDDRLDTASMKAFVDTPLWNRPNAEWSWRHYLGPDHAAGDADDGNGAVSPFAAPARATDLAGLPPAYVSTMEFDPLRDEGIHYGLRLLEAGVSVELHSFAGTFHGSSQFMNAEASQRNLAETLGVLRRRLGA